MPGVANTRFLTKPTACWPADILLQLMDMVSCARCLFETIVLCAGVSTKIYAWMFVEAMATAAKATGCVKMDWVRLGDNDRALRFYHDLGWKTMRNWVVLKGNQAGLQTIAIEKYSRHNSYWL